MTSPSDPAAPAIAWADPAREAAFERWLAALVPAHQLRPDSLRPASADASFRRYFRIDREGGGSLVVMDAPPPQEDIRPFIDVDARLAAAGLRVPPVLAHDDAQGFVLLGDLGERLMLSELQQAVAAGRDGEVQSLMRGAIAALVQMQQRTSPEGLPAYDEALLQRELTLFPDWCVQREFGRQWTAQETQWWQRVSRLLLDSALAQPTLFVHRDYMPRNLMVGDDGAPGILDFQDAVRGPIAYDLASLIRDAFISWDEEQEIDWCVRYWEQARKAGLPVPADFGEFWRQIEWMGLQRHLKVLGIFCRLKHRDGKAKYVADLPRFFAYAHKVARRYSPLAPLARLLEPLMGTSRIDAFY